MLDLVLGFLTSIWRFRGWAPTKGTPSGCHVSLRTLVSSVHRACSPGTSPTPGRKSQRQGSCTWDPLSQVPGEQGAQAYGGFVAAVLLPGHLFPALLLAHTPHPWEPCRWHSPSVFTLSQNITDHVWLIQGARVDHPLLPPSVPCLRGTSTSQGMGVRGRVKLLFSESASTRWCLVTDVHLWGGL